MESVRATLPTLGEVDITFYRESEDILAFFGNAERARLDKVLHLGPASRAFTGLNHSRWEYTLLQCALVQYVSVVFKGHPDVALKGTVEIDGPSRGVSSGEELLKAWALLGNVGHTQWTYGVERGVLRAAQEHRPIRQWLSNSTRLDDLKRWIVDRVEDYDDLRMHYVLALRRIAYGAPYDRRKTRFAHLIRNLVLPIDDLLPDRPEDRSKLSRLRRIYERIRLLSLVTLDAYYSHKPLRVSLHTTINSFGQIAGVGRDSDETDSLLTGVAAWLADHLYLHPEAAAIQLEYEQRVARDLPGMLQKARSSKRGPSHLLANLFNNGLGDPWVGRFRPLFRLSFPAPRRHLLGPENVYVSAEQLREEICHPPHTDLAIDRNPFSDVVHLDFLWGQHATLAHRAAVWVRATQWLLRALEADALAAYRRLVPSEMRGDQTAEVRKRFLQQRLQSESGKMAEIFRSVLESLLPPAWSASASPFLPSQDRGATVLPRILVNGQVATDVLVESVSRQLDLNPDGHEPQRLHEIKGLSRLIERADAPVLLGCMEPIHLYDAWGRRRDDWDATLLEIDHGEVRLNVFEGKTGGGVQRRANKAFKQLDQTRQFICGPGTRYRRTRLTGLGAVLQVRLSYP